MSHRAHQNPASADRPASPRGQILVIFAFLLTILIGFSAFVVDLAWIWSHQLQVQRAADAGALAGVVHLPADPGEAASAARAESRKNGYTDAVNATVLANPDPSFNRRMNVTVSTAVDTFFMGLFGWDQVTVQRTSRAEYILPVPMGSPQHYYGVGRLVNNGPTVVGAWETPDTTGNPSSWTNDGAGRVNSSDDSYTTRNSSGMAAWRDFDIDVPDDDLILGIEVQVEVRASAGSCRLGIELSKRADLSDQWTSTGLFVTPPVGGGSGSDANRTVGGTAERWGLGWDEDDLEDNRFGVRVQWINVSGCATISLDRVRVRVHSASSTEVDVYDPYNSTVLVPQNFWGGMQSQGAPAVQGDAFMTKFTTRTSSTNPTYCPYFKYCPDDAEGYYNYGIEIPTAGGEVWIFDPGFCDVSPTRGTGEYWTTDAPNGADPTRTVSAFYRLYDTNDTAYDFADDTRVDLQAGNGVPSDPTDSQPMTFRRGANNSGVKYWDSVLRGSPPSGSGYTDCTAETWHNDWWRIGSGLPAGTYRLHTTSHDRILTTDQDHTTALNAFGIWARSGAGTNNVRVYGLGAMEAYFPLPANSISQFYLAQIEAIHAGKWVDISLWDPGDTGSLTADLSILRPTTGGYSPVDFHWNSIGGTELPSDFGCGPATSSQTSSIRTNSGSGGSNFQGRWLRLCFQLPDDYAAPIPPADGLTPTGGQGPGWFRIQYNMGGGSQASTDLTTWKVEVRGNPVHLIIPEDDTPTP